MKSKPHSLSRNKRLKVKLGTVAVAPATYGEVDDNELVRRIYIRKGVGLTEFKHAVLRQGFEDQYRPDQIQLFTEGRVKIRTDRQLARALSYEGFELLAGEFEDGLLCVVVGAMNTEEDELMVVPLPWPIDDATVAAACSGSGRIDDYSFINALCGLRWAYRPLPPPVHRDDWQAQVRERAQSVSDLASEFSPADFPGPKQRMCLLPVIEQGGAHPPTDTLHAYLEAFYDREIALLPPAVLTNSSKHHGPWSGASRAGKKRGGAASARVEKELSGRLFGRRVAWRNYCTAAEQALPAGQYNAAHLLAAIGVKVQQLKSTYCVLAVTMVDLFSGSDDLFTGGLAMMEAPRSAVFTFARYDPAHDAFSAVRTLSAPERRNVLISRACKTAAHEVMHMLNIGHCMYRHCCMNGSGHLREDFSIPHQLCPVCVAKLKHCMGKEMQLARRARKMLAFFQATDGFERESAWLQRVAAELRL